MTDFAGNMERSRQGLKDKLRLRINATFKRSQRSPVDPQESRTPSSSGFNSECSTLIDFAIYDNDSILTLEAEANESDLIHSKNRTWGQTINPAFNLATSDCGNPSKRPGAAMSEESLLDEDNCAWTMPRTKRAPRTSHKLGIFSRRPKEINPAGIESEMLDPENSAWV